MLSLHSATWHNMVIITATSILVFQTYFIFYHIDKYFMLAVFAEINAKDMISGGALWELVRISRDCSREDIRALARRTLISSSTFEAELRRLRIEI